MEMPENCCVLWLSPRHRTKYRHYWLGGLHYGCLPLDPWFDHWLQFYCKNGRSDILQALHGVLEFFLVMPWLCDSPEELGFT